MRSPIECDRSLVGYARFQATGLGAIDVESARGGLFFLLRHVEAQGLRGLAIDGAFAATMSNTNVYLGALNSSFLDSDAAGRNAAASNRFYGSAVESTIGMWAAAQSGLDELLQKRIDGLVKMMHLSLALTGALAALSIIIAVMTHPHGATAGTPGKCRIDGAQNQGLQLAH
jgi:hypothetical protein